MGVDFMSKAAAGISIAKGSV